VSSISCGLARSRSLVGEKPTQVAGSHGPGIQPCRCSGNPAYRRDLMRGRERKPGAMGNPAAGGTAREGVRYGNRDSNLFLVRRCNREGETNKYAGKERDAVV